MVYISGGTVHGENGAARAADILVDGASVVQIAGSVDPPPGCEHIRAEGLHVYPGFVLPVCSVGVRDASSPESDDTEDLSPLNPHLQVRYALNIGMVKDQHFANVGITSFGLSPGMETLISGNMALVSVGGETAAEAVIADDIGLKGNYTGMVIEHYKTKKNGPSTHMAMFSLLDGALRDALAYSKKDAPDYDDRHESLLPLLRGEKPLFVNAYTQQEIEAMLELKEKYSLRLVLLGAYEADRCAEKIVTSGTPVVLGELTNQFAMYRYETDLEKLITLSRSGLELSLSSSGDYAYLPAYDQLLWSAALLRQAGAGADEVIDMMTVRPARALGVSRLVGSLEEGKRADLILCTGNPAARYDSRIVLAMAGGKKIARSGEAEK